MDSGAEAGPWIRRKQTDVCARREFPRYLLGLRPRGWRCGLGWSPPRDAAQANTEGTRAKRAHPSILVFSMERPPLRNPSRQFTSRASVGRLSQAVKPSRRAALLFLNVEGESTSPLFSFVEEPLLGRSGRRIPLPVTLRQTVILRARLFRQEHPQGVNSQRCA